MFQFDEADTRIFQYSQGERAPDGSFLLVFADPAAIKRQLSISLPDRNQLIDQFQTGVQTRRRKFAQVKAYEADPAAYVLALAINNGYQSLLPVSSPEPTQLGQTEPNPESPAAFVQRSAIPLPIEYTGDENAAIRMGGIAEQKLNIGIRAAFGLLDFDPKTGMGCTDDMATAVYFHYMDWLEKKDGNTPPSPTSSPPSPDNSTSAP